MHSRGIFGASAVLLLGLGLASTAVQAGTINDDPLQAQCIPSSDCYQLFGPGGDIIVDTQSHPTFDLRKTGPGNADPSGHLWLDVMIPDSAANANGMAGFQISCTTGCTNGIASATLFSSTEWNSGNLADYLSLTDPVNPGGDPINAWIGLTNEIRQNDALTDANGYFVYQLDFGSVTFVDGNNGGINPVFSLNFDLPQGTIIAGFLLTTCKTGGQEEACWVTNANSEALLLDGGGNIPVPEPLTLSLFGVGLVAMGAMGRRRRKSASVV